MKTIAAERKRQGDEQGLNQGKTTWAGPWVKAVEKENVKRVHKYILKPTSAGLTY